MEKCHCATMCRPLLTQINGSTYAAPTHVETCPNYKLEPFFQVGPIGSGLCAIVEWHDLADMIANEDDECVVRLINMTRDQFLNLKEFQGF